MNDGLFLSFSSFARLTAVTQAEILNCLCSPDGGQPGALTAAAVAVEDEGPADLSENQVRKFIERCSPRTIATLRVIADAPATGFRMKDVGKALEVDLDKEDIRGVWSAITRRTRSVLDNPKADLIWWDKLADEWFGWVSPTTHRSLRKVIAKRKN